MKYGRFAKNILIYFSFRKEKRGREEGPEQDPAQDLDLDPPSVNQGTESHLLQIASTKPTRCWQQLSLVSPCLTFKNLLNLLFPATAVSSVVRVGYVYKGSSHLIRWPPLSVEINTTKTFKKFLASEGTILGKINNQNTTCYIMFYTNLVNSTFFSILKTTLFP